MNIAKLNTVSLDDKTFIIKRGTSGGANINNQNKVVDITENGTVDIVPDAGYTGLAKVTANVNVSGGGELEGDYYLARPNGWYWRLVNINDSLVQPNTAEWDAYISGISLHLDGQAIYDAVYKGYATASMLRQNHFAVICSLGKQVIYINEKKAFTPLWAISEKEAYIGELKFSSIYEFINMQTPMTEAEVEAFLLENAGLQRITKEEYESLITA